MKLQLFQLSLTKIEILLAEAQGKESAEILSRFCAALEGVEEETTVAQWVKHIKKKRAASSSEHYPSELKRIILSLEDLYRTTGPVRLANDFKKILELFNGSPGQSVEEFIEGIRITGAQTTKNTAPTRHNSEELKAIARQLSGAMQNQEKFDSLLHSLAQSDEYSLEDMSSITSHIMGYPASYPSKEAAAEAIKNKRLMNTLGSSQLFSGSRLF